MPLYSIDVKICGTAYIKAESEAEAMAKTKRLKDAWISSDPRDGGGDIPISGAPFNSDDMPEISLSPAMTCCGLWDEHSKPELQDDDE